MSSSAGSGDFAHSMYCSGWHLLLWRLDDLLTMQHSLFARMTSGYDGLEMRSSSVFARDLSSSTAGE